MRERAKKRFEQEQAEHIKKLKAREEQERRSVAELEQRADPPPPEVPFIEQMRHRLDTREGRQAYDLRQ